MYNIFTNIMSIISFYKNTKLLDSFIIKTFGLIYLNYNEIRSIRVDIGFFLIDFVVRESQLSFDVSHRENLMNSCSFPLGVEVSESP